MKDWLKNKIIELYPGTSFDILTPPNSEMGDYSVNLAFVLAKERGVSAIEAGAELVDAISKDLEFRRYFSDVKIAGNGFINFYLSVDFLKNNLLEILKYKDNYGSGEKKKASINLEFVSANPTGPITVHNIRAAPYGDTLANILLKAGYKVTKEYYINDAGNQVRLLGESVARRYIRLRGKEIDFPENLYQGEYITDIARKIDNEELIKETTAFDELVSVCRDYTVKYLIGSIKQSLVNIGTEFDVWFSEKDLHNKGEVENTLKMLENGKHVYTKDGARWLKLGEAEDIGAVLVKSDGTYSYLMGDIAYTRNKFIRGFDRAINIWGTDHHGDVARLKAGVKALNYNDEKFEIILHQLVMIKKNDEVQRMSKRKGEFVLLDELVKEVGKDAIRYFFLAKDLNTHMEFDVDLAREESKRNPVYYIQYANARLNSIFDKLKVENLTAKIEEKILALLKEPEELSLIRRMVKFPELIDGISKNYQVHHLAQYAYELASDFHNFYEKHHVVQEDDKNLEKARAALCSGVSIILGTCLSLMGISAPKRMDNQKN